MSPAVITSKAARNDIETIRSQHSSTLDNYAAHSMKLGELKKQQDIQLQNQSAMESEAQKQDRMFALKEAELNMKQATASTI